MMKFSLSLVAAFSTYIFITPAQADVDLLACIQEHNQCISVCSEQGVETGCVVKCASQEAQCAGGVGLEKTVPFIRDAARDIEGLLFDFFEEHFPEMIEKRRKLFDPSGGTPSQT